jgi:CHAT domain-containing protein/Tfp pilus assembly protein PilF
VKYQILFLLAILTISTSAQITDSLTIKQVDSLILVSREFTANGDFEKALAVNATAEALALKIQGKESVSYAGCTANRGRINIFLGDLQEAEKWYSETITLQAFTLGNRHPEYASTLIILANLYTDIGKFELAEPLYFEAKDIQENTLGREHPSYAHTLNCLGTYYDYTGQYEKAGQYYIEAKTIRGKILGKVSPQYAGSLINIASIYNILGNHEKAEPLYLEAKVIFEEKLKDTEHPFYMNCLNNLALHYSLIANYSKAEPLLLKALSILENVKGKNHPDYAISLGNLANFYYASGDYTKAEPLFHETKLIREKTLGKAHPDYAISLGNLGANYLNLGFIKKAESLLLEAKELREKILGKEHPHYAESINNCGELYTELGQYTKAEALFMESKDIRKKVLGPEHPQYAESLKCLADLYSAMGNYDQAESYYNELATLNQSLVKKAVRHLSNRELISYINQFTISQYKVLSFLNLTLRNELAITGFNNALFYKGFLLQATEQIKRLSLSDSAVTEKFNLLKSYERRLATQYVLPITDRDTMVVHDLLEKTNKLEKNIARMVSGFENANRQVSWKDVQLNLNIDEIAVEFVHYHLYATKSKDSILYAALILKPGETLPQFIPLFEEKELDHLLNANQERKADYVNELYARADRGIVKLGSEKKSLYDLIWAKIEAAGLEDIKTVYYSPSGVLHRLNLGAIAIDEETILSDRYNLVAMNSTRQLVIPSTLATQANDALLIGGVNFEVDTFLLTQEEEPLLASRSADDAWTESGTRGGSWSYLKWTEKEVERIGTTLTTSGFRTLQFTGSEATEEAFKAIGSETASPRILHIATHGFFFPDPEQVPAFRRGLGEVEPVFKNSDNPMIRSGLILAGGNYAWKHGRAISPDKEDGILTAYEISQMNLSNTEMVVLSACETGLGDIKGNEGVYGLQRAFKIAGAKYIIMSLWQVPDRETMEFMTTFYGNWLEENMTIPDAFRKTQREMRDRFFNPYSWAGFVLVE